MSTRDTDIKQIKKDISKLRATKKELESKNKDSYDAVISGKGIAEYRNRKIKIKQLNNLIRELNNKIKVINNSKAKL